MQIYIYIDDLQTKKNMSDDEWHTLNKFDNLY
jgi:hypothetical protein